MGALSTAERAEAIRNACFFGAFFGGTGDTWPGERFVVFDLHRRLLSAATSKLGPDGEIDWAEAERSAALYRELVELVADGAARPEPGAGGSTPALERLREIGVIAARTAPCRAAEPAELRLGLIEAAFACGAETEAHANRFVIVERRRVRVSRAELDEVVALGFASSAAELDGRSAGSGLAERSPDLLAAERRPAAAHDPRGALGKRQGARAEHRPQQLVAGLGAQLEIVEQLRDPVALRHLSQAVGLQALEHRVAVPGREHLGHRAGPRRPPIPDEADAEERRHAGEGELVPAGGEVLDRGQDPVARAALAFGDAGERHPALDRARLTGDQIHVAGERLAVLGRDPLGA